MSEPESINTMWQNSFVKINDGEYALQVSGAPASGNVPVSISQTGTDNAVQSLLPIAARATSATGSGQVTSPGAGIAIAGTPSIGLGTWDIEATGFVTWTTVPGLDSLNMEIKQGGNNLGRILVPVGGTTGAVSNGIFRQRIQVTIASAVSVHAIVAATTDAIYIATISATRVM
jgi:hypothetical protein